MYLSMLGQSQKESAEALPPWTLELFHLFLLASIDIFPFLFQ